MNANPYMLPAIVFLAVVLAGCGVWALLAVMQPSGQHSRRRAPNAEAARFAAHLRGEDPGEQPAPVTADPLDDRWWDEKPPPPMGCLPVRQPRLVPDVPRSRAVPWMLLARVRDALMPGAWRPEPAAPAFTPADPGATRTDLPAVDGAPYLAAPQ